MVVALALLLPGSFADAKRLDPDRPGAAGYLFCAWNTVSKIDLRVCSATVEAMPSYVLLEEMMRGLTELFELEEVFQVDVLLVPARSTVMSSGLRGFYEFQTGMIFVRDNEPDDYRTVYVMAHEIAHAIMDQVKGIHGGEHHRILICDNILSPIADRLDKLAQRKLKYDDPRLRFKFCMYPDFPPMTTPDGESD
jgi:hypothetical protein